MLMLIHALVRISAGVRLANRSLAWVIHSLHDMIFPDRPGLLLLGGWMEIRSLCSEEDTRDHLSRRR